MYNIWTIHRTQFLFVYQIPFSDLHRIFHLLFVYVVQFNCSFNWITKYKTDFPVNIILIIFHRIFTLVSSMIKQSFEQNLNKCQFKHRNMQCTLCIIHQFWNASVLYYYRVGRYQIPEAHTIVFLTLHGRVKLNPNKEWKTMAQR